jgi:hypothetical protein
MDHVNKELHQCQLIDEKQFALLESIRTRRLVSLYYELRLLLYLGIMLFTGGIGYLAYQNMGEMVHLLCMTLMGTAIVIGFYFIQKFAKPYDHQEVKVDLPYFDYLLLLVSLLIISLWVYVQVYFDLVAMLINWSSFISAAIFIYMAYRYDNRALLSMGITAIAAAVGISITPVDWATGDWSAVANLYITSLLLGAALIAAGFVTYLQNIKQHFRFTYINFGLILYFIGCLWGMFGSEMPYFYALLTLVSAGVLTYYSWREKEFLFFLYSNITTYITITYLIFRLIEQMNDGYFILVYYFPASCIGYIFYLIKQKSHFTHD